MTNRGCSHATAHSCTCCRTARDITSTNTTQCLFGYDLFSLDTQPTPSAGDQVYCASGYGIVGGVTLGPGSACEADTRL